HPAVWPSDSTSAAASSACARSPYRNAELHTPIPFRSTRAIMSSVRHVSDNERRARVVNRHHLAPRQRGNRPIEVARDLVGLHASDPASVFLAIAARTRGVDVAMIESILYDDHELIRVLCMRRTVFTVPL